MITKYAKQHFYTSLLKSILRILGCITLILDQSPKTIALFSFCFAVSEILGIVEEVFDKR